MHSFVFNRTTLTNVYHTLKTLGKRAKGTANEGTYKTKQQKPQSKPDQRTTPKRCQNSLPHKKGVKKTERKKSKHREPKGPQREQYFKNDHCALKTLKKNKLKGY